METANKKQTAKSEEPKQKPKSKTRLFWDEYPNGIGGRIVNMRAVLR